MPRSTKPKAERSEEVPGGAVAVFFFLAAGLFALSPWYFGAVGTARTAWYTAVSILGLIGFLGALTELAQMSGGGGYLRRFGLVIVAGVLTLFAGIPPLVWSIPAPWDVLLKIVALLFALVTVLGLSMESGRWYSSEARRIRLERVKPARNLGDTLLTIALAVLSLATSVVGLVAAVAPEH